MTKEENERRLELIAESCGPGLKPEDVIALSNLQCRAKPHISCPEVFDKDEDLKLGGDMEGEDVTYLLQEFLDEQYADKPPGWTPTMDPPRNPLHPWGLWE